MFLWPRKSCLFFQFLQGPDHPQWCYTAPKSWARSRPATVSVQIQESEKWKALIEKCHLTYVFSSLHANSPRHKLSLEIAGEGQGSRAVQLVQLQLLSFCKLLGGKASMVRVQGVGELVKQTSNWGRSLIPSNATLVKLMETREITLNSLHDYTIEI